MIKVFRTFYFLQLHERIWNTSNAPQRRGGPGNPDFLSLALTPKVHYDEIYLSTEFRALWFVSKALHSFLSSTGCLRTCLLHFHAYMSVRKCLANHLSSRDLWEDNCQLVRFHKWTSFRNSISIIPSSSVLEFPSDVSCVSLCDDSWWFSVARHWFKRLALIALSLSTVL